VRNRDVFAKAPRFPESRDIFSFLQNPFAEERKARPVSGVSRRAGTWRARHESCYTYQWNEE
jgi:hypothetical protein